MTEVVVFGAGGYSGLELLRWLSWHPSVGVAQASSDQLAGRPIMDRVPSFPGDLRFKTHVETLAETRAGQIALLATPAETAAHLVPTLLGRGLRVIDLSGAHRLTKEGYPEWYGFEHPFPQALDEAVYGLTELVPTAKLRAARLVANPGCYATAAVLAAAPLLRAGLVLSGAPLVIDGKSGSTGAGRALKEAMLFSEVADDIRPYRILRHQHTPEMERFLEGVAGSAVKVLFSAHLVPLRRGLVCSVYAPTGPGIGPESVERAFSDMYGQANLIRVSQEEPPNAKRTLEGPYAEVGGYMDSRTGLLSAFCAIDNLVKGAAGQAIQNLNAMLGHPLDLGLRPRREVATP